MERCTANGYTANENGFEIGNRRDVPGSTYLNKNTVELGKGLLGWILELDGLAQLDRGRQHVAAAQKCLAQQITCLSGIRRFLQTVLELDREPYI